MTDDLRDELAALEAAGEAETEAVPAPPVDAGASAAAEPPPGDGAPVSRTMVGWPAETAPGRRPGTVTVKLERFEGPLDLLLHLIKRDEIDIYDIPIAHITQQYLAYIDLMRSLDLDVAGEFIVMAATLMRIKAKMLLPLPAVGDEESEGDPREELVQRLIEYRQFKEAANTLKLKEAERRLMFERGMVPTEDEAGPLPLAPATLFDLLDALNRVLARVPQEQLLYEVQGEQYDIEDKIALIANSIADRRSVSFTELLLRCHGRPEMIVTFMALLEIIKLGMARVIQSENFADIIVLPGTEEEETGANASDPSQRGD